MLNRFHEGSVLAQRRVVLAIDLSIAKATGEDILFADATCVFIISPKDTLDQVVTAYNKAANITSLGNLEVRGIHEAAHILLTEVAELAAEAAKTEEGKAVTIMVEGCFEGIWFLVEPDTGTHVVVNGYNEVKDLLARLNI